MVLVFASKFEHKFRRNFAVFFYGAAVALFGLSLAGCGGPQKVTYVDPNPDAIYGDSIADATPFVSYGADTLVHAKELLMTVSYLRGSQADQKNQVTLLTSALEHYKNISPRLAFNDAAAEKRLRLRIMKLVSKSKSKSDDALKPSDPKLASALLDTGGDRMIPYQARKDPYFYAAVWVELLEASALELSTLNDDNDASFSGIWLRFITILKAVRDDAPSSFPEHKRSGLTLTLKKQLTPLIDRATKLVPESTGTNNEFNSELVSEFESISESLLTLAETLREEIGIVTDLPEPAATSPDHLRRMKGDVAALLEAIKNERYPQASRIFKRSIESSFSSVASPLAAVDTELFLNLERDLLKFLPKYMNKNNALEATRVAARIDARLDEALTLIENELEQLRVAS